MTLRPMASACGPRRGSARRRRWCRCRSRRPPPRSPRCATAIRRRLRCWLIRCRPFLRGTPAARAVAGAAGAGAGTTRQARTSTRALLQRRGARPSRRRPTTHTLMTPSAPFGAPVEFTSRSACSCVCSSSRSAWAASAAVPQQPPRAVTPSARLRARAVWGGIVTTGVKL